ncbi:preprotein translocase subunit SecE [Bartonella sp. DGB1]|uniref:preprotein translocase subunit SecE n=1 Tax=Bartonella sp. DGB1 TaxID=3239807 RepID=UPI003523EF4B
MASKSGVVEFFKQVRAEVRKVVWPSRKETVVSLVMVLILVFLSAIFFFVIDQFFSFIAGRGVSFLVGLFR